MTQSMSVYEGSFGPRAELIAPFAAERIRVLGDAVERFDGAMSPVLPPAVHANVGSELAGATITRAAVAQAADLRQEVVAAQALVAEAYSQSSTAQGA